MRWMVSVFVLCVEFERERERERERGVRLENEDLVERWKSFQPIPARMLLCFPPPSYVYILKFQIPYYSSSILFQDFFLHLYFLFSFYYVFL